MNAIAFGTSASPLKSAKMSMLVELPRPNSSEFTFKEPEKRKAEIFTNWPTRPLVDWKKPKFGKGFCIHITADDRLQISNYDWLDLETTILENVSVERLKNAVNSITWLNEPASIVVTSEQELSKSKIFPSIMKLLFKPSVRLFYVPNIEQ